MGNINKMPLGRYLTDGVNFMKWQMTGFPAETPELQNMDFTFTIEDRLGSYNAAS
jgi:hypothetical protein